MPTPAGSDPRRLRRIANSIADAVDAKGGYVEHSRAVARLALMIATEYGGMSHAQLVGLELACLMHDAGKLQTPDPIILKDTDLDLREWEVVRRHAHAGHKLLMDLGMHEEAAMVLHHHERWDGHGYPYGLQGDQIPVGARIIGVADAFEVMTAPRPYKLPMLPEEALGELERCAGTQFDPRAVRCLIITAFRRSGLVAGPAPADPVGTMSMLR